MPVTISRTELARNTREVIEQVRKGEIVVVESYGEKQVVLLDAIDYELLKAVASANTENNVNPFQEAIRCYLREEISLGKMAQLTGINRFELIQRFVRLGIPLALGPKTIEDARQEVQVALSLMPDPS